VIVCPCSYGLWFVPFIDFMTFAYKTKHIWVETIYLCIYRHITHKLVDMYYGLN